MLCDIPCTCIISGTPYICSMMKPCLNSPCLNKVGPRGSRCQVCKNYLRRTGRDRTEFRVVDATNIRRGPSHALWKGDSARPETKRQRMSRLVPIGPCEHCGRDARDRHHIDGDTGNNSVSNVVNLCRRCHMIADGRLAKLRVNAKIATDAAKKPPRPCSHCGRMDTRFWRGQCHTCDMYERRTGNKRPLKISPTLSAPS